ncbi:MAG: hypothetical protein DMF91_27855, partial [Acidobacteria bacterium]
IDGIRKALVDEMKKIKPPVVRWPGGCFADSYDWRDGIGAPDNRPRRTDFWADTRPGQNRAATTGPQRPLLPSDRRGAVHRGQRAQPAGARPVPVD